MPSLTFRKFHRRHIYFRITNGLCGFHHGRMIRDISVKFGHQNENDPEKEQKIDEY